MKNRPDSSDASASSVPPNGGRDVLDWARSEGVADQVIADLDRHLKRRRQRRKRTALAAAALLFLGGAVWRPWNPVMAPSRQTVVSRDAIVLRAAQQTLPDGTVVELNEGAEIDVDFSGPLRRVVLRRGEGHFQVAKNPQRAFVVSVGDVEVRAVGTAFSVDRSAQHIEVLVTEGRVAVEQAPVAPGAAPAAGTANSSALGTLDAGASMVLTRPADQPTGAIRSEVSAVSMQAIGQRLAWRVPRLEFSATPLSRVVVLFNEEAAARGGDRIELSDSALGRVQLSGVLRADDIESLLRLLAVEFQIRSERQGSLIVLRRG